MKLLVLGGTRFVGRALVASARDAGHEVTIVHRGRSAPSPLPGVESLLGDRSEGLPLPPGRRWDAAIDTSGYVPRVVGRATEALRDRVDHYVFVSTISVYAGPWTPGMNEDAPRAPFDPAAGEDVTGETYGPLKSGCEDTVRRSFGARALVVRPGLIVGPHDPTGRFTYWVERVAAGGEILAPGAPSDPVQFVDVRDLAGWMLMAVTSSRTGTFHVSGPETPLGWGAFLDGARAALGTDARFTWAPEPFLAEHGVTPWAELPAWVPSSERGLLMLDLARVLATGIRYRPLADTVRDTLAWARSTTAGSSAASPSPPSDRTPPGLNPQRERALLDALKAAS